MKWRNVILVNLFETRIKSSQILSTLSASPPQPYHLPAHGRADEKAQQPIWGKIWNNQHQDYPHHKWLQCMNQWFGWWVRNERMGGSNPVLFQCGDNFTLWVKAETASRVILKLGYWVLSATYQTAWKSRNFLILILGKGSKIEEKQARKPRLR